MSDWYLGQLARQDQYGDTPLANWPEVYGGLTPDERGLQPQTATIGPAEMRSYQPTLGERIKGGISDLFRMGGADPYNAGKMGDIATTGLSMFPPIGIPVAKSEMERGVEAREPTGIAMGALGAIPGAKGVLGEIAKPFYSAAGRAVDNAKLGKGTADQWLGYLRNQPGVKPEELQYVFGNLPEGQLTKAQMQAHAAENAVQLGEVTKGIAPDAEAAGRTLAESHGNVWGELSRADRERYIRTADGRRLTDYGGDPKYSQWQLPGGENYRETLLTLPTSNADKVKFSRLREIEDKLQNSGDYDTHELNALRLEYKQLADETRNSNGGLGSFRSSHWDEPNVLAHVRTNDREIPGVGKSLHVEEIQSDWHQKGRTEGYAGKEFYVKNEASGNRSQAFKTEAEAEAFRQTLPPRTANQTYVTSKDVPGLPDAPFKSTWADVALKRQIREASEKGYDAISWTPGKAQADRYKLSNQLKELQYLKNEDGTYEIAGITISGDGFNHPGRVTAEKLSDVVGKEMAQKIVNNEGKRTRGQNYDGGYFDGIQLDVGGEGMKAFYDKMLIDKANAIGKKHGARVEQAPLPAEKPSEIELRRLHDNTAPDEIATAKYSKQWDELLADKHAIEAQNKDPTLKQSPLYKQAGLARINQIEGELDKLHQVMVSETVKRVVADRKGPATHVLRITPELRAAAMKGFPLFTAGGIVAGGTIGELARRDKYGQNE